MRTDSKIKEDVIDELIWDPMLRMDNIDVDVKNQIVTLSGTVDSFCKRSLAENAARRILGVKEVELIIGITLSGTENPTDDDEITLAILNILKWNVLVPHSKIKTNIKNGFVTFEGEVQWGYQKTAVYNSVKNVFGITGIINNIKIASELKPCYTKEKICGAFKRSATIDAENIEVEIKGAKIILNGTAYSWCEKEDAEKAAFSAQGITEVENKIVVDTDVQVY
jgi:osmotically-inducible protein OsmY